MACQNVKKLCKACQRFQEKKRRNFEWTCQRSLVSLDLPSLAFNKRSLLLDSPELLNMSFIHEMCDYIFLFWRCRIKVYHVKSFSHCVVRTLRSDSNKDWGLVFFLGVLLKCELSFLRCILRNFVVLAMWINTMYYTGLLKLMFTLCVLLNWLSVIQASKRSRKTGSVS